MIKTSKLKNENYLHEQAAIDVHAAFMATDLAPLFPAVDRDSLYLHCLNLTREIDRIAQNPRNFKNRFKSIRFNLIKNVGLRRRWMLTATHSRRFLDLWRFSPLTSESLAAKNSSELATRERSAENQLISKKQLDKNVANGISRGKR